MIKAVISYQLSVIRKLIMLFEKRKDGTTDRHGLSQIRKAVISVFISVNPWFKRERLITNNQFISMSEFVDWLSLFIVCLRGDDNFRTEKEIGEKRYV